MLRLIPPILNTGVKFWLYEFKWRELNMTKEEMKARTRTFALRVIRLVQSLPGSDVAKVIGNQLLRSGRSVGANYRAACRARSTADFIAKLGIVEEETDESIYWIELLYQTENGLRKNCGSPHEVRAQTRHTYFVRVSAIFANQFCLGIVDADLVKPRLVENLLDEAGQILAIIVSTIKTSKENRKQNPKSDIPNPKL
jgi:four helix bundle protein